MNAVQLVGRIGPVFAVLALLLGGAAQRGGAQTAAEGDGRGEERLDPRTLFREPVPELQIPYDAVRERRLPNGLRLVAVADRSQRLVDVAAALDVGGRLDGREGAPAGIAPFVASLLTRGGTQNADPETLDLLSEQRGIRLRSVGGRHRSGVLASGVAEDFDRMARWVADLLRRPAFDAAAVQRYRTNALSSLDNRWRDAGSLAQREWEALVLGADHPRIRPLRPADVRAWTPDALRSFHGRHYRPESTIVAIAGDIDAESALDRFAELLGDWTAPPEAGDGAAWEPAEVRPAEPGFYQVPLDLPQGYLLMGRIGGERRSWSDADADAALLLSEILAGVGPVSRLRARLRDRESLVYSVQGSVGFGSREPGLVQISWSVAPEKALAALAAALEELERLRRFEPPAEEVRLARRLLVNALPGQFDTAEEIAGRWAEDLLLGRPHDFWKTYAERLERIGPAQVRAAARHWLDVGDFVAVWVGPPLPERDLKRLGFRRVQRLER